MPRAGSTAEERFAARQARLAVPLQCRTKHNVHTNRAESLGVELTQLLVNASPSFTVPRELLERALAVANYVRTRP